jgi:uncharacterized damage-inducible protein DinB
MDSTDADILERYAGGPALLEAAIAGLSDAELDRALEPGSWSIRQLVHHVVDGDDIWKTCLKAALGNSGARYSQGWYATDNHWAATLDYAARPVEPALALLRANRAYVVELLRHLPDGWSRHVVFRWDDDAEPRTVTPREIVAMQARHVDAHLADIRAIRTAYGRATPAGDR